MWRSPEGATVADDPACEFRTSERHVHTAHIVHESQAAGGATAHTRNNDDLLLATLEAIHSRHLDVSKLGEDGRTRGRGGGSSSGGSRRSVVGWRCNEASSAFDQVLQDTFLFLVERDDSDLLRVDLRKLLQQCGEEVDDQSGLDDIAQRASATIVTCRVSCSSTSCHRLQVEEEEGTEIWVEMVGLLVCVAFADEFRIRQHA